MKVKRLEWVKTSPKNSYLAEYHAQINMNCKYVVKEGLYRDNPIWWCYIEYDNMFRYFSNGIFKLVIDNFGEYHTSDEAKDVVRKHYESLILSGLETEDGI